MLANTVLSALSIAFLFLGPLSAASGDEEKPLSPEAAKKADRLFEEGNAHFEKGELEKALASYEKALAISPKAPGILYNAGLAAYLAGKYERATELWGRLKKIDPADWQVRAKLVQAWQALGKTEKRDAERAEIYELRKKPESEDLRAQAFFCRDQFRVADCRVMVFEHFELVGDRAVRYRFVVMPEKGEEFRISLGSYKETNDLAHELGMVKEGERRYHLDGYFRDRHELYGMYNGEPKYDDIRKKVIEILERKRKAAAEEKKGGKKDDEEKKPEKKGD